jgi:hypothetical protein
MLAQEKVKIRSKLEGRRAIEFVQPHFAAARREKAEEYELHHHIRIAKGNTDPYPARSTEEWGNHGFRRTNWTIPNDRRIAICPRLETGKDIAPTNRHNPCEAQSSSRSSSGGQWC